MKLLIKLILGVVVCVMLVLGALVLTVAYLDPNDYKESIAATLKEETGRSFNISGDINLSYYPWLGLDVSGVEMGNAKGFGDAAFFKAETINARVKLLPLLRKQLEMDTFVLHGATINLAKNKDGVTNWDDLVKDEPKEQSGMPLGALVLGGIDIKDANLNWHDQQQSVKYQINKATISTGELKFGEPIDIVASLNAAASKPALSSAIKFKGTVAYEDGGDVLVLKPLQLAAAVKGKEIPGGQTQISLASEIRLDMNKETLSITPINLTAFDTTLNGDIQASNIMSGQPQVNGAIDLIGKDLPQLFKILEVEPLASQLAKLKDKSFDIKARFSADLARDDVDISTLNMKVLGNQVEATVNARNIKSATPAVKGKIKANGSDLPALIIIASQFAGDGKQDTKSLSKQLSRAPKEFEINTEFDSDLKTGAMAIPTLSIKALGMTTNGSLIASQIKSDSPAVSGALKASGSDLPLIMRIAGAFQPKDSGLPKLASDLGKMKDRKFDIDTRFNFDLKTGKVDMPALDINTLGFKVQGNLKGSDVQKNSGSMAGKIAVVSKNPKPLLSAMGQADIAKVLKSIDINTGISGNMENLNLKPLSFKGVFSGKDIPNSPVALNIKADTALNMNEQNLNLKNFSVAGLGLDIKGKLSAKKYVDNPSYTGEISIAPFNLKKLSKQLNFDLPPTADSKVLNTVALDKTTFSATKTSLQVKQFKAQIDDSRIQGNFNVKDFAKSEYEFGVGIDKINADRYLPPEAEGKPATPETAAVGAATELPLETLRALNIKGDLVIGDFVISNAKLKDIEISINSKDGLIKLTPIAAKLYGGTYKGAITLDARGKQPLLTMDTNFANVNVEPLQNDMLGSANLTGLGNINLALTSKGSDINVLRSTLSGNGKIDFRKGVLRGVDIRSILQQVEVMYESKRPGKVENGEQTEYDSLTGTLKINSGVIDNDDMLMLSPGFRVIGNGMLMNLNDETWKYNLTASVDETTATKGEERYNIGGYSLSVKCRGKVADKKCLPDLESIFKALFKNTLGGALEKAIGLPKGILGGGDGGSNNQQSQPQQEPAEQQQQESVNPAKEVDKAIKGVLDKLF